MGCSEAVGLRRGGVDIHIQEATYDNPDNRGVFVIAN